MFLFFATLFYRNLVHYCSTSERTACMSPASILQLLAMLTYSNNRNRVRRVVRQATMSMSSNHITDLLYFIPFLEPLNVLCMFIIVSTKIAVFCVPSLSSWNRDFVSVPIPNRVCNSDHLYLGYNNSMALYNGALLNCSIVQPFNCATAQTCPLEVLVSLLYIQCSIFFSIRQYWHHWVRAEQQRFVLLLQQKKKNNNMNIFDEIDKKSVALPPSSLMLR